MSHKKMGIDGSKRLRFGAYEADLHTRELWKHGTRIKLVGQPFEILAVLVQRPGQLVTREELRMELWPGDTFVDFNHGLNAAVNKLRDALCDSVGNPKYIETLPRRGYRFISAVENVSLAERAKPAIAPVSADPGLEAVSVACSPPASAPAACSVPTGDILNLETVAPSSGKPRPWLRRALTASAVIVGLCFLANIGIQDVLRSFHRAWREKGAAEAGTHAILAPLTALSDLTAQPAFSPDGTRVAFRRESFVPGNSGIWVKQIGEEKLIQLTNGRDDRSPVWSPDGRNVAFSRLSHARRTIYEVPATGGEPRRVYETDQVQSEMDWSPDGRTLALSAKAALGQPAIFLLAHEQHTARQVTTPSGADQDWGPAFSPDGNQIAFVRTDNVMVMSVRGGDLRRLTSEPLHILGSPAWAFDGQSIIFAARYDDRAGLWRVPASGGALTPVREAGNTVWDPAVSRRGFRLAFELSNSARSIDQIDLDPPGQKARALVTSLSGENAGQQLSPDGSKLVFQSDRTGSLDIWVSDRDGQNAIQLTAIGTAGSPRWSPDGKEIAFDVGLGRDWQEPRAIFLVNADGGAARPLLEDNFSNNVPRWSRDGQWIYFASNRTGEWQIWKIRKTGGSPVQVTQQGGFAAMESPDGEFLYYAKHNYDSPEIWRIPVAGGSEAPVFPGIRPLDWGAWTVHDHGICFVDWDADQIPTISFYDFAAHGVKHLAALDRPPFWLTATHDGKSVIFDQPGQEENHVMLLENFR
ncbi:MAG: winged helix-turn-helix domain-containing protein [Terriglobales bacterium]